MQKMFTHLSHVSWGQCVFSTVMNGKLLINWCNHHTKKKKNRWVFRQNACNRIDEIYYHVGAKSLVCLPEHVSHFSTLHQIINHSIYSTNYHFQRILCRILESPQKHFWRIVLINAYPPDFLSLTRLLCKASSCGLSTARLISMKGWLGCSQSPRPTNFSGKSQQTTPTLAILRLEWISFLFEQVWNWKCLIYKVWSFAQKH